MKEWRFWFAEQRGTLLALGIFVVMFVIYTSNHPAGFTANVVETAANKGVLLAFVAMFLNFSQKGVEAEPTSLITIENRVRQPKQDIVAMRKNLSRD